jgi:hypothetical protein
VATANDDKDDAVDLLINDTKKELNKENRTNPVEIAKKQ